jgi:hypothetical protein
VLLRIEFIPFISYERAFEIYVGIEKVKEKKVSMYARMRTLKQRL